MEVVFMVRLKKNLGFANVPVDYSDIGTNFAISSPKGMLKAGVCKKPWFPAEIKISLD